MSVRYARRTSCRGRQPALLHRGFPRRGDGGEKALAFYADGRISALFGTHTHVATADEQILPQGTGFITDVGMTGPVLSCLGVKPELSIEKMRSKLPVRFAVAEGACAMDGVLFTLDDKTGRTTAVRRVRL